jgi:RimJ/RimL family protein N-acetyltransferase
MILPGQWGKRYGSAIAKQIIDLAETADLHKLKAIIDPNNIPSRKILMNVGFTSEFIGDMEGLPGEILNLKMQSQ